MEISSVSNLYQTQEVKKDSPNQYDKYSTFAEILAVNSTQNIYQTQQANSLNANPYKEEPQKDYSSYNTFAELKNIPYEEAKANYDSIMKRANELKDKNESKGIEEGTKGLGSRAMFEQLDKVNISNNETLNKALYETLRGIKDPLDSHVMNSELQSNLENYYHGYTTKASFQIDEETYGKEIPNLTRTQLSSINVEDFLSKMTSTFTKDYEEASSYVKNQYKAIIDGYSLFQQSYNQSKKEPFYA
ncbi:hypothetical protein N5U14_05220 [Aliarcobacter butzleri]|uniref:hypothetical protein n=1 Tax=Aliarcobacter butzleri TaxID=28197 RepID=UPI0021B30E63|nr:hypothetical protein [Aliarcobacter butzleri]MCT7610237.1 hypothetical protein [Aliarcobacter butzleri]